MPAGNAFSLYSVTPFSLSRRAINKFTRLNGVCVGAVVDAGAAAAGTAFLEDGGGDAVFAAQCQCALGAAGILRCAVGAIRRQHFVTYDLAGFTRNGQSATVLGAIGESHPVFRQFPQVGIVERAAVVAAILAA